MFDLIVRAHRVVWERRAAVMEKEMWRNCILMWGNIEVWEKSVGKQSLGDLCRRCRLVCFYGDAHCLAKDTYSDEGVKLGCDDLGMWVCMCVHLCSRLTQLLDLFSLSLIYLLLFIACNEWWVTSLKEWWAFAVSAQSDMLLFAVRLSQCVND